MLVSVKVHRSDLVDADGVPMRTLPEALQANASFTKVSWQDPNILQKIFVKQFPHGTGGFTSSLDTFSDFKMFMLHTIHSLDGEFLDDKDGGEFLFFAQFRCIVYLFHLFFFKTSAYF